jgi:hypothetical protein
MKKTKNTPLVQELIRQGVTRQNAYRIINARKPSEAGRVLRIVLAELLALRKASETTGPD